MSDPIAQAAEALSAAPSSTDPVTGNVLVNETPTMAAPEIAPVGEPVISPSEPAPAVEAATSTAASDAPQQETELPRETHLMMLEAKIAGFRAKLVNAERVALDEFEAIVAHVKAVL
ncbi:hypothetical protein [Paraburkholderia strydomiana]|uniref:hypothetical protein n=1 Tax=Paraburkholderia strydomiana TaxID=1245417 RepID=UPI00286730B2|nr:hypothetical protein [Paraburkholderia strydomiana]MDR7006082.1 hypothetical protein [Paraburkholderia strydomiana]